ncbi:hypothetical protein TCAL_10729, partial [Tigriopus californicus]|eukprot:TCALIF_10729-PA protein Name:"Similar to CCDC151 Coiled-coil domain-containing protein 151 (Bos taurus)" AED:0.09 eAED:0.09 QI:29/0.77/0.4/0.9/1/0.9/10/0/548
MEGDRGGTEFRERGSIFKQMGEMKKKIQLVEGERKAIFEDCENEKTENKEKMRKLKEEIRDLQNGLQDSTSSSEALLRHVQDRKYLDTNALKRKTGDDAVETLDYKVADLRKQLDKLKFKTKQKTTKIDQLLREYAKVVAMKSETERSEDLLEDSEDGQRLRFLENEIHKTNLKLMEGETIKKKYNTILDMLKKERLTFGNQLENLEGTLKKQDDEIVKLKKTHQASIVTRDLARQNQHKKEVALLSEGRERERRLIEYRKTAEDRKNYFESMERHMFASKTSVKETGRESISTSDHAHSRDDGRGSEEGDRNSLMGTSGTDDVKDEQYEEAFGRMKKAAGVSDIKEVVHRFETQEETSKHLHELQTRAEKEIRDLGAIKEKLEAEWEVVKFMGQEENTELRDKMEDLEEKIADEQSRKKSAEEKLQSRNKLLVGIREGLDRLTDKLFLFDPHAPPVTRNSIELLSVAQARLKELMDDLDEVDLFGKKLEMDEEEFVPVGLVPEQEGDDEQDDKEDVDSGPDDEEVPTRGYLKRQANLIVDAKSRSKR